LLFPFFMKFIVTNKSGFNPQLRVEPTFVQLDKD